MLRLLNLVDRFNQLERGLPKDWTEARLTLTVDDGARCDRAAALLGPASPGRLGKRIRFTTASRGTGIGPDGVRRLLRRLEREGIRGELDLAGVQEAGPAEQLGRPTLRRAWEEAVAALPSDWSDVYAEVRFVSTDYLEPAALQLAPVNPSRSGPTGLRFRCAHHFGYGVSPEMAARSLERCGQAGMSGEVEILHALSDTHPVGTQGPVWLQGGRVV